MYRQRNDKDCAITVIAHVTGLPYTSVINAVPTFRYSRSRPRSTADLRDRVVGRQMRIRPRLPTHYVVPRDPHYGRMLYNFRYRSCHPPYWSGGGVHEDDYTKILGDNGFLYVRKTKVTVEALRHIPLGLLSVPSLNVQSSGHMVLWQNGRIYDPSPNRRYDFHRLRATKMISVLAVSRNTSDFNQTRRVLRVNLSGDEIMSLLAIKALELLADRITC
jgi:hypothetical protein